MNSIYGIILAGGLGTRMGSTTPKQLLKLRGKSLIAHSVERFSNFPFFKSIVVVSHPDTIFEIEKESSVYLKGEDRIVEGGDSRHESTLHAIRSIKPDETDVLVIHDAARPFFTNKELFDACKKSSKIGSSTLASNVLETVVNVENGQVSSMLDRDQVFLVKTPQVLQANLLGALCEIEYDRKNPPTDLCSWVSLIGKKTAVVLSNPFNIKVTRQEDLDFAEKIYDLFLDWENQNPFDPRNYGDCGCRD